MSALAELAWEVSSETRESHAVEIHTIGEEGTSTLRSASLRAPQLFEPPYTDPYVRWCGRGVAAFPRSPLSRLGPPCALSLRCEFFWGLVAGDRANREATGSYA